MKKTGRRPSSFEWKKLLLIHRHKPGRITTSARRWGEFDESFEEACIREVRRGDRLEGTRPRAGLPLYHPGERGEYYLTQVSHAESGARRV